MQGKQKVRMHLSPEHVLMMGFAAIILVGALLLSLPWAGANGTPISFFNALFTATSATCVTGLAVLDTALDFSVLGQTVILLLIQVGGLGFMLFSTLVMLFLRRRISLQGRLLMRDSVGADRLQGVIRAMLRIGTIALLVEGIGAALLAVRFVPEYGWKKGIWFAVFHAISAFCNAGFDLFGQYESLLRYEENAYILCVIALLIVLGGIGYAVIEDVWERRKRGHRLNLHSKMALSATVTLLLTGFLAFCFLETEKGALLGPRLLQAFFQSVTTRTAGFSIVDQMQLSDGSKLIGILLMFIGASPASTGGGVKTTTVYVLLLTVAATVSGREDVRAFRRTLPLSLVRTALCILLVNLFFLLLGTLVLSVTEAGKGVAMIDLAYETASALSTVGLSTVGTYRYSQAGKWLLLLYMYFGRVGPMTIMLALAGKRRKEPPAARYPEEHLLIG